LASAARLAAHLLAEALKLQLVDFLFVVLVAVHDPRAICETLFRGQAHFKPGLQAAPGCDRNGAQSVAFIRDEMRLRSDLVGSERQSLRRAPPELGGDGVLTR